MIALIEDRVISGSFRLRRNWFCGNAAIFLLCLGVAASAWGQNQPTPNPPPDAAADDDAANDTDTQENAAAEDPPEEEAKPLPKLSEMQPLSVAQLMKGPAEDWILLVRNDEVVVVQPVNPRPGTLEFIQERIKNPAKYEPEDIGRDEEGKPLGPKELALKKRQWRRSLPYLEVHLPFDDKDKSEDADKKYYIKNQAIQRIIYFEDMMLGQIDQYLDEKLISEAYEMIVALRLRDAQWQGLEFREHRLLFAEAELDIEKGRLEQALVNLEQLHNRNPQYPELSRQMGQVFDQMIASAYEAEDYRQARHFLSRLEKRYPQHQITLKWTEKLSAEAAALIEQAQSAENAGQFKEALGHVEQAALLWPASEGLNRLFTRIANRHQVLRVGVLTLPKDDRLLVERTDADERRRLLTSTSLFEPDQLDGSIVRYRSRFLTQWEPSNLGRRVNFQLRPHRQSWESQDVMIAMPLIQQIAEKMTSAHGTYDERFSDRVDSVSVQTPFEFDVKFQSVPFRTEPLFSFPLNAPGTFTATGGDEQRVTYQRTIPEPAEEKQYHVAEIEEIKYPDYEKSVQGLLRGEVSLLPHVALKDVERIAENPAFFTLKYQLPVTAIVQFNPRKKALHSQALRRALAYSLNLERMLTDYVLKDVLPEHGRLTSAPFPKSSYAYDPGVPPIKYDIELALALTIAAKKDLGGEIPPLKMRSPPDANSREISQQLIRSWARIGVKVELLPADAQTQESEDTDDWDLAYREITMHEPAVELWPLVTLQPTAQMEDLNHLPHWLRTKFVELDRAANWGVAQSLLHELQRIFAAEMLCIPLWELDDYLIVRKTVRGVPEEPISTYDDIEQWIVQPWYPRD